MRLVTWNVLHRVHAENWREDSVLARYPNEEERIAAVATMAAQLPADVFAMQEVSGDQLAALHAAMPDASILRHPYARLPRLKSSGAMPLRDPREFLVTVVRGGAMVAAQEDSASDPGKGLLAVDLADGTRIVNVHVSKGEPGVEQVLRAVAVASERERAVILGDFNALHATLAALLPEGFRLADPLPGVATRVADVARAGRWIDHAIGWGCHVEVDGVTDVELRSDHQAVGFSVR